MMMVLRKTGVCMAVLLLLLSVTMEADTRWAAGRSGEVLPRGFASSGAHHHAVCALQRKQVAQPRILGPVEAAPHHRLPVDLTDQNWRGIK
jgi:hypothetical protein